MGWALRQNTSVPPEPVVVAQPANVSIAAISISAGALRPVHGTVCIGFLLGGLDSGPTPLTGAEGEEGGGGNDD